MEIKKDGKFIVLTDKDFTITVNKNFIHLEVEEEGVLIDALQQAMRKHEELQNGD